MTEENKKEIDKNFGAGLVSLLRTLKILKQMDEEKKNDRRK